MFSWCEWGISYVCLTQFFTMRTTQPAYNMHIIRQQVKCNLSFKNKKHQTTSPEGFGGEEGIYWTL